MSCLFIRINADAGLSSLSAIDLDCKDLASAFLDFAFDVARSGPGLEVARLRDGSFGGISAFVAVVSFSGTFIVVVRGWKKSLVTSFEIGSGPLGAYCSV